MPLSGEQMTRQIEGDPVYTLANRINNGLETDKKLSHQLESALALLREYRTNLLSNIDQLNGKAVTFTGAITRELDENGELIKLEEPKGAGGTIAVETALVNAESGIDNPVAVQVYARGIFMGTYCEVRFEEVVEVIQPPVTS